MTDPNMPVTEDELHAFVDNELPPERRGDVEAWLAAHPDDAERAQSWISMAEELHVRYDSIVNEPVPKRLELERVAQQPRRWIYGAIAASLIAFAAGGGAGWFAHGVATAQKPFQSLTLEALDAYRLYVVEVRHPVEVPGDQRVHLQAWLTKRCGWDVQAPDLERTGLKLVGGRLLPGLGGPASFLMYESPSGERFTVYAAKATTAETQMRYTARDNDGALAWTERGVGFVVTGGGNRDRLTEVARLVYDQTEKTEKIGG